jgi:hypothetical protein
MCELKVIIDDKIEFKNAIYAKLIDNKVIVSDIFGKSIEFKNYQIAEVNITKEMLILSPKKNP